MKPISGKDWILPTQSFAAIISGNDIMKILLQWLGIFGVAVVLIAGVAHFTGTLEPRWDAEHYINMASQGVIGNPDLCSPFAYRPGMPFLAGSLAHILDIPVSRGFRLVGLASMMILLLATAGMAWNFTGSWLKALLIMVAIGLSGTYVKFPLFFYSMVDVAAYPLIVLAFFALLKKRYGLCLLLSCIGLLFKEFLGIPLALLLITLLHRFWINKTTRNFGSLILASGLGLAVIAIPRIFLSIKENCQEVDFVNKPGTLRLLWESPLDQFRDANLLYSILFCWLPVLLLVNRNRFEKIWKEIEPYRGRIMLYIALNLLLAMYGGTNILFFVSYSVPLIILALALLLKQDIHPLELLFAFGALVFFNKILIPFPSPDVNFDAYIDFYGTILSVQRECSNESRAVNSPLRK
jgi:hypothetical protein